MFLSPLFLQPPALLGATICSSDVSRMSADVRGRFLDVCRCFPDVRGCPRSFSRCLQMFPGCPRMSAEVLRMSAMLESGTRSAHSCYPLYLCPHWASGGSGFPHKARVCGSGTFAHQHSVALHPTSTDRTTSRAALEEFTPTAFLVLLLLFVRFPMCVGMDVCVCVCVCVCMCGPCSQ